MKQETLEEAAERLYPLRNTFLERFKDLEQKIFIEGAKEQQERRYSEEEVHKIIESYQDIMENNPTHTKYNDWFEQFKKK